MLHQVKLNYIVFGLSPTPTLSSRRDKIFCHHCRFCCTVSICSRKEGDYFKEKNITSHDYEASRGYLEDTTMYKNPDYRCLKPKPGLPSSQWPHYDMEQHRAAKSLEELDKVEEIPFDKESSLFYRYKI